MPTGICTLPQLPVGAYELSATAAGFKKYVRTGITVRVAQALRIDVALEMGTPFGQPRNGVFVMRFVF